MAFRSRGLPSTGCNKCRSRKIRCDERKPTCANCEKIGHAECRYRDEFERTWRIQTDKAVVKTQRQREPAETSFESVVFHRCLHDWACGTDATPGISVSWFTALPAMYANASPGGLLHTSIQVLANANYGKRLSDDGALRQAASQYGQVLTMLRDTLPDMEVSTWEVLASILMLGIYETLVDKCIAAKGGWMSHMAGASMLLKRNQQRTPLELKIRAMITRQMLHASLITGQEPMMHLEQGQPPPPSPLLKHIYTQTNLLHQAASICTEWRRAFVEVDMGSGPERLVAVAGRALSLDRMLDEWSRHLPSEFVYTMEPTSVSADPAWLQSLFEGPWAPQASHHYATGVAEMLWRFYWVARMILGQALLHTDVVLRGKGSALNPVAECRSQVEFGLLLAADRLCESCLGPLVAVSRKGPSSVSVQDVPSLHGYLMLQIVPTVELCLEQIVVSDDLSGRKDWIRRMKVFLGQQIGFEKATADLDPARYRRLPIQMWSMTS
ncbi:hypothetical protein B0I35DRAFT_410822 [Stachybotrys elegans]|uniref:Zn(2)-C6 fungal-type domain-containing protein n=1 Tax=Stachybotrys elegans TaxID=80388 RepID=A0A8K0SMK9_9HYPO|nr:hypothetical protein B0I35DRAFT_410822 [Stachybotrys elegans]